MIRTRLIVLLAMALVPALARAQLGKLGVMGDSLSDEYGEETYSYAKNWPMQLHLLRAVDCGQTAAEAAQSGGTWGEPRRKWYKHDWARSGADSVALLSQGQHTGLASQSGAVTHAVLAIGANDFAPGLGGAYFNIYNGNWSQSQIDSYCAARIANVTTATDTVLASGIRLVLVNFPDYGVAPSVWRSPFFSNATKRQRVTVVIQRVNAALKDLARNRRIPYIDMLGLSTALLGANGTPREFFYVGNTQIQLWNSDTSSHTNPYAGFVHDGVHPHTTLQGTFANLMITALNAGYGTGLSLLSESEILTIAGLPYGGSDTVEGQIGPYSNYVTNFVCPPDYNADGFVDGIDYDTFNNDFESPDPVRQMRADYNGDGFVDGIDYDQFNNDFEAGC